MSAAVSAQPAFFGRAWKVTIDTQAGDHIVVSNSAWENEALRVSFSIERSPLPIYWCADIEIYNLSVAAGQALGADAPTAQTGRVVGNFGPTFTTAIQKSDLVTISAGYQKYFNPDTDLIWRGRVFQVMWERNDATELRLRLRCLLGLYEDETTQISQSFAAGTTLASMAQQIATAAGMAVEYIDPSLNSVAIPRAQSVFNRPSYLLAQIAATKKLNMWISPKGLNLRSLVPRATTPDIVYAPPIITNLPNTQSSTGLTKQTLIGAPQQTELGASFRVLLDSQLELGQLVKLDMSVVRMMAKMPGPTSVPSLLDQDGLFIVAGLRHVGDTRGNDWHTEVEGITPEYARIYQPLMGATG
ncbi:MAG TPA: hypothetical protein VKX25_19395 [Bryobacteraceae bacterium]|jgi:hypothetical protein|nr:hypothetical protein [Bryobacteraceae bacterium]